MYFECSICIPITDDMSFTEAVPVLVVLNTTYNSYSSIPLLIGNNVSCKLVDFLVELPSQAVKVVGTS